MRVLYVEDDPLSAAVAGRTLAVAVPHAELFVAGTLAEARARLGEGSGHDVVLTDLQLPDGSGLDLVVEIRERALPLAVVVLTGLDDGETAVAALQAGADDFVVKREGYFTRLPGVIDAALCHFRAEESRRTRPLRVLYAEDSAIDIDLTRRHLARHAPHIRLDVVHSVPEVIERLPPSAHEPAPCDVLLLDFRLSGMDAFDVLKTVRGERRLDLPVVLVTGQGDAEVAAQAFRFGATDYLVKHQRYLSELPGVLRSAYDRVRLAREHAALLESEDRYRDLVENSLHLICTHDLEGRVLSANQAACQATGLFRGALVGMRLHDLVVPEMRPRVDAYLAQIAEQGRASGFMRIRTSSGEVCTWEYSNSLRAEAGAALVVRGIARDVTAQRKAERTLRESEARLAYALDATAEGLWDWDIKSDTVVFSPQWIASLGYAAGDVPPSMAFWKSIVHPDDLAGVMEALQAHLAGLTPVFEYENRLRMKSGRYRHNLDRGKVVERDADGNPLRMVGTDSDITERKQAEEQLRASEQRYERVVRLIQDGLVIDDRDGRIIFANRRFFEMFGLPEGDGLPNSIGDRIAPESRAPLLGQHRRRMRGEDVPTHFEFEGLRGDGTRIWVEINVALVVENGRVVGTQSVLRDITNRKLSEQAMQVLSTDLARLRGQDFFGEVATRLAQLLGVEIGFVGNLVTPSERRVLTLGLSVDGELKPRLEYDLAGTPCEQVVGKRACIFPNDVQRLFAADRYLADERVVAYVAVPLFDSAGHPIGHVGIMGRRPLEQPAQVESILQMFAVRTGAEIERLRTEARFENLFESSRDGILMVDTEGRVAEANGRALALFEYAREELIGAPVEQLVPEASRYMHVQHRLAYQVTHEPRTMCAPRPGLRARRKDGSTFPVDIGLNPLSTADGRVVVATVRDVTESVRAEEARQGLEAQLRESQTMAAMGQLVAGVAHEVRNPLFGISASVDALEEEFGAGEGCRDAIGVLRGEVWRLNGLMQELLDYGRPARLDLSEQALEDVVAAAIEACRPLDRQREVVITNKVRQSGLPSVRVDRHRLVQVFQNLLANAIHFSPPRGCVTVAARLVSSGGQRWVACVVDDAGPGFREEDLPRVFEPFFTRRSGGTGLGLAIAARIVHEHGGRLTAANQPEGGAAMTVMLPCTAFREAP